MNHQQFTISKPNPSDYNELTAVWEASVRATHHFLSESDFYKLKPLVRNEYLKNVELCCIRDEKKNIAAFIGLSNDKVEMLFVRPDTRGMGLGKQLLTYAINFKRIKYVDVNEQNTQALAFYEHYGFKFVSRDAVDAMGKPYPIVHLSL
ncbi:MAG: GNAT family N-acetyltransferase [Prevotellaceae bacterium]|jgi:putative acetyltransferase|nr:GNAT family N-acetyltransferase [Prevotellaceae bacterium]